MNKTDKINMLTQLIEDTGNLVYGAHCESKRNRIVNSVKAFIHQALETKEVSIWTHKIECIRWLPDRNIAATTPDSFLERLWTSGKNELYEILNALKREIEHDMQEKKGEQIVNSEIVNRRSSENNDNPIIFLSHCSSDTQYGDALAEFITGLGVKDNQLIYTSHPLHKIPLDENIYDYLRKHFDRKIFVIILWSHTYLDSPACLCEMGAAWVTKSDYTNIYTPSFQFDNPKYQQCAIDPRKMGAVLNGDRQCKTSMIELKNKILLLFGLENDEKRASNLLDVFIEKIKENGTLWYKFERRSRRDRPTNKETH